MIKTDPVTKIIIFKGEVAESYTELSTAIKQEFGSIRIAQQESSRTIKAACECLLRFGELLNNPTIQDLDRMVTMKNRILSLQK